MDLWCHSEPNVCVRGGGAVKGVASGVRACVCVAVLCENCERKSLVSSVPQDEQSAVGDVHTAWLRPAAFAEACQCAMNVTRRNLSSRALDGIPRMASQFSPGYYSCSIGGRGLNRSVTCDVGGYPTVCNVPTESRLQPDAHAPRHRELILHV